MSENTMAETQDTQAEAVSADAAAQVEQTATAVPEEVAAALEGRAAFYETLAGLFWMPLTAEQVEAMANQDFSACHVIQTTDQIHQTRLRTSGSSNDANRLTGMDVQIDILQDFLCTVFFVSKIYILK